MERRGQHTLRPTRQLESPLYNITARRDSQSICIIDSKGSRYSRKDIDELIEANTAQRCLGWSHDPSSFANTGIFGLFIGRVFGR